MSSRPLSLLLVLLAGCCLALAQAGCGDLEEADGSLSSIYLSPSSATLEVGRTGNFTSYGNYSDGTVKAVAAAWILSGEVGSITASGFSCILAASAEGQGTLTASYLGKSVTAAITVTATSSAAGLTTIEVSPAGSRERVGAKIVLTATGWNASGESITISPTWEISPATLGTFSFSGTTATFEALVQGLAVVRCRQGTVSGTAYVTVEGFSLEITAEADTYVDENSSTEAFGGAYEMKAGYVSVSDRRYSSYLRFSLADIPGGVSIESAALMVYPSSAGGAALQIKRLTSLFDDATTWVTRPSTSDLLITGTFSSSNYNSISSNELSDLVRQWFVGTAANYGLAIGQDGTTDGTVVILTRENSTNKPKLRVEYK